MLMYCLLERRRVFKRGCECYNYLFRMLQLFVQILSHSRHMLNKQLKDREEHTSFLLSQEEEVATWFMHAQPRRSI